MAFCTSTNTVNGSGDSSPSQIPFHPSSPRTRKLNRALDRCVRRQLATVVAYGGEYDRVRRGRCNIATIYHERCRESSDLSNARHIKGGGNRAVRWLQEVAGFTLPEQMDSALFLRNRKRIPAAKSRPLKSQPLMTTFRDMAAGSISIVLLAATASQSGVTGWKLACWKSWGMRF
jgi:hypothetical protein